MRQRCNNPNHHAYSNYGGRGITICAEWEDYAAFKEWAIGAGYDEDAARGEYTLDRIDVDKGYSPDNCRFVDMRQQANNRRVTIVVEHNGEKHPLTEWAQILGVEYTTLWRHYKQGTSVLN